MIGPCRRTDRWSVSARPNRERASNLIPVDVVGERYLRVGRRALSVSNSGVMVRRVAGN